jgi:hypothetical protein
VNVSETKETRLSQGGVTVWWNDADNGFMHFRLAGGRPQPIGQDEAEALAALLAEALKRRGA